jgi:hypothetical protein
VEDCLRQHRRCLWPAQVVTGSSTTLTTVKLHMKTDPGAQCVFIRGYTCRSLPPVCQCDSGGHHPGAWREMQLAKTAVGPVLTPHLIFFFPFTSVFFPFASVFFPFASFFFPFASFFFPFASFFFHIFSIFLFPISYFFPK